MTQIKLSWQQSWVEMWIKPQRSAIPASISSKAQINTLKGIFLLNKDHEVNLLINGYLTKIKMSSEIFKLLLRILL